MDLDALISEIYTKVQERVAACEQGASGDVFEVGVKTETEEKPVLGILAQEHGMICHPTYESEQLHEYYNTKCALLEEDWEVDNLEGVIAYTLTVDAMGKIANGIFDTDYTRAFGKAMLCGKKIFVPQEEVELYRYKETAPKGYYAKLSESLDFLKENGVVIVPNDQLINEILGTDCVSKTGVSESGDGKIPAAAADTDAAKEECVISHKRKVLSERDLIIANQDRVTRILVTKRTIVTDLARDYAKKYHITIETVDCL